MTPEKETPGALTGATGDIELFTAADSTTGGAAAARDYAARGWHVFPAPASGEKKSLKAAKHSGGRKWGMTTDPEETLRDWRRWPNANIGIVTGAESGIFVLDLDCKDGVDGVAWLADRVKAHGPLPDTIEADTPSGGRHVYFRWPDFDVKTCAGEVAPGVDVRGTGGMVLAPPSVKPGAGAYSWANPPGLFDVADAPAWLLDLLPRKGVQSADTAGDDDPDPWQGVGFADEAEVRRALDYIDPDASGYEGWREILMGIHDGLGDAGLPVAVEWSRKGKKFVPGEIERKWSSFRSGGGVTVATIFHRAREAGADIAAIDPDADLADLSHDALALDMGRRWFDANARHVALWGKWLFWEGQRWQLDEKREDMGRVRGYLRKRAAELIESARRKAGVPGYNGNADEDIKRAKAKAKALRDKATVAAVESLAQSNPASMASPDDFDADLLLLGTPGGTVDLRTGGLRPAVRGDLITKQTSVAPAPEGVQPKRWLQFLDEVFDGDQETIDFMKRAAGYSLTGLTTEHKLLFLYGTGRNGKSVFLNVLQSLWADYAHRAAAETFLNSRGERHPTDIAALRGARLVVGSELPRGRTWNEAVIKDLTGGEPMTARFMRQDAFTFQPQLTLMIAGNAQPSIHGVDEAMRARLVLVPFTVTIPEKERDPDLTKKLLAEGPAILRWAIEGADDWQLIGLDVPKHIAAASADYMDGEDIIGQFLDECTQPAEGVITTSADLHDRFTRWAEDRGLTPWAQHTLIKEIRSRGFPDAKTNGARGLRGLLLSPWGGSTFGYD